MYSILDFGAVGDGEILCTKAIQSAIDAAAAAGGGTVYLPAGHFKCGTIYLKSYVTLHLTNGAVLQASDSIEHYPEHKHWDDEARAPFVNPDLQPHSFIFALDVHHIAITGEGTIQLPGEAFWDMQDIPESGWIKYKLPRVSPSLCIHKCEHVRIENVKILDSSGWTVECNSCRYVWIKGIFIKNHFWGPNTDGLDIQGCQDVMISDCRIDVSDDCIVLKTLPDTPPNERITVTNCTLRTQCVGLKCGANESFGDMRQIAFTNCIVHDTTRAFSLYAYCGGHYEDIVVSNILCDTKNDFPLNRPIQIDVRSHPKNGKKHGYTAPAGSIRNVTISNVIARTNGRIVLTAEDDCLLENIVLRDIRYTYYDVDNPDPRGRTAKSGQWCVANPDAGAAQAVIAAENIKNLVVDGLYVDWPDGYDGPAFSLLWGKNLQGGRFHAPDAFPSHPDTPVAQLENSTLRVVES
ncbi:MAG: glycoside hydrolase family 28 protein [Opitutales bacterium]